MLGDDNHDRRMARNQLVALTLMSVLFLVWIQYFSPPPPVQRPAPPPGAEQPAPVEPEDVVNAVLDPLPPPGDGPAETAAPLSVEAPVSEELVVLENGRLRLTFTSVGARLKEAEVILGAAHGGAVEQLVPTALSAPPEEAIYPLGVLFSDTVIRDAFNRASFAVEESAPERVVFAATVPGAGTLRKTYALAPGRPHVVQSDIAFTYGGAGARRLGVDDTPAFMVSWAPNVDSRDGDKLVQPAIVWRAEDETNVLLTSKLEPDDEGRPFDQAVAGADWVGRRSAYYVVAMRPAEGSSPARFAGLPGRYAFGLGNPSYVAEPGAETNFSFELYVGPNTQDDLGEAWDTLPSALRFFAYPDFMDAFAKFLLRCMNWIHATAFNSYGVAIILLTIAVRVLMLPLTLKQMKSMKRLQLLAPEMERIKNEHPDDPAKQQEAIMKLWREYNANPLGGCLPLLFQMPVFIALYRMLSSAYELRGAPFLYIEDLSQADKLFHIPFMADLPLIGSYFEYFNLIPILGAVAMILSIKLSPQSAAMANNPQQKLMMTILPVVFSLMFYTWPSGLNLYVLTSTVLGIAQMHLLRLFDDKDAKLEPVKPRAQRKRQHWYAAAVAKKKQLEKEQAKGNGANKGAKAKAGAPRNRKSK